LQVPSLRARPAKIAYVYTDARNGEAAQAGGQGRGQGARAEPVVRRAMLVEDDDTAVARLGGTGEVDAQHFTGDGPMFSVAASANMAFAEALIGNFDWCVRFTMRDTYRCDARLKLWNVIAVATGSGKARPLIYDFDVSGMVTGSHRWFPDVYNEAFVPSRSQREVEVRGQVQRTRSL